MLSVIRVERNINIGLITEKMYVCFRYHVYKYQWKSSRSELYSEEMTNTHILLWFIYLSLSPLTHSPFSAFLSPSYLPA